MWRLSDGALLRTLDTQSHWTVTVQLRRPTIPGDAATGSSSSSSSASASASVALLTMSKKEVHVFRWSEGEGEGAADPTPSEPSSVLPIKPEGSYQELRDAFFTPGLSMSEDGRQVTFVRQMPLFETQTIGKGNEDCQMCK